MRMIYLQKAGRSPIGMSPELSCFPAALPGTSLLIPNRGAA